MSHIRKTFRDRDINKAYVSAKGACIQFNKEKVLNAVDDCGICVLYLEEVEIKSMLTKTRKIHSVDKRTLSSEAFNQIRFESCNDRAVLFLNYDAIESGSSDALLESNCATVVISSTDLSDVLNKFEEKRTREASQANFDNMFNAMTGCKIEVSGDSNKRVVVLA